MIRFQANRVKPRTESEEFVDITMWQSAPGVAFETCVEQERITLKQAETLAASLATALATPIGDGT